jgi:hypothetical protein
MVERDVSARKSTAKGGRTPNGTRYVARWGTPGHMEEATFSTRGDALKRLRDKVQVLNRRNYSMNRDPIETGELWPGGSGRIEVDYLGLTFVAEVIER